MMMELERVIGAVGDTCPCWLGECWPGWRREPDRNSFIVRHRHDDCDWKGHPVVQGRDEEPRRNPLWLRVWTTLDM